MKIVVWDRCGVKDEALVDGPATTVVNIDPYNEIIYVHDEVTNEVTPTFLWGKQIRP